MLEAVHEERRENMRRSSSTSRIVYPIILIKPSKNKIKPRIITQNNKNIMEKPEKTVKTILSINPVLPEPSKSLVVRKKRRNNDTLGPLVEIRVNDRESRRVPLGD